MPAADSSKYCGKLASIASALSSYSVNNRNSR